ncbi:homeodomain-only protein [Mugil cephalus]|uniref:homeodomain-only protein n=1 Tax=Mugil cephalus TaxID=48193 RepID=UPI001FB6261F|nr:homeodomain-only protein [Mugil cephalus]
MSTEAMERLNLSEDQVKLLEENFRLTKDPQGATLMMIAAECGLSDTDAKIWFRLRYAQWRKAEGLPAERGKVFD